MLFKLPISVILSEAVSILSSIPSCKFLNFNILLPKALLYFLSVYFLLSAFVFWCIFCLNFMRMSIRRLFLFSFSFLKFSSALRTLTQSCFVPFVLACLVRDFAYKFSDL